MMKYEGYSNIVFAKQKRIKRLGPFKVRCFCQLLMRCAIRLSIIFHIIKKCSLLFFQNIFSLSTQFQYCETVKNCVGLGTLEVELPVFNRRYLLRWIVMCVMTSTLQVKVINFPIFFYATTRHNMLHFKVHDLYTV